MGRGSERGSRSRLPPHGCLLLLRHLLPRLWRLEGLTLEGLTLEAGACCGGWGTEVGGIGVQWQGPPPCTAKTVSTPELLTGKWGPVPTCARSPC